MLCRSKRASPSTTRLYQIMIRNYYILTKPGIIFGNAITAIAGFFLASKGTCNIGLFIAMLIGLSLIVGSGCVFNSYIDKDIDEKMERTRDRPLVQNRVSDRNALIFGTALLCIGSYVLGAYTNPLTLILALSGFFVYTVLYTIYKLRSVHGTLVGSIAGAIPPVVGYCSVSNTFDMAAFILFMIVVFWQMPHFFAIAIYRFHDYKNAGIPVLPVVKGMYETKKQMLFYTIAFTISAIMLTVFGYTGYFYLTVTLLLCYRWLRLCIQGFSAKDDTIWAKKMFFFSLVIIMSLSIMIPIDVQ